MRAAFTLVEIMIVVAILGILVLLATPAMYSARRNSQNAVFVNDIRKLADAMELYAMEQRGYPPDRMPGQIPAGFSVYAPSIDWADETAIGGQWDWDFEQEQFGCKAGLSVYRPDRDDSEMRAIDALLDDGNLATGFFRKRSQGYIYIIEL